MLVRVAASSVNPIDFKMRSGAAKERYPVEFPGILGRDISGVVRAVGEDVKEFVPRRQSNGADPEGLCRTGRS